MFYFYGFFVFLISFSCFLLSVGRVVVLFGEFYFHLFLSEMASILRFRKLCYVEPEVKCSSVGFESFDQSPKIDQKLDKKEDVISANNFALEINKKRKQPRRQSKEWRCLDSCCWIIGYLCTTWWLLLLLYHCLPVTLLQVPELPAVRLKREGLTALHPVVFVPGIITGGLELWEGRPCADGLFRKRLWGGSFTEIFKRYLNQVFFFSCINCIFWFEFGLNFLDSVGI